MTFSVRFNQVTTLKNAYLGRGGGVKNTEIFSLYLEIWKCCDQSYYSYIYIYIYIYILKQELTCYFFKVISLSSALIIWKAYTISIFFSIANILSLKLIFSIPECSIELLQLHEIYYSKSNWVYLFDLVWYCHVLLIILQTSAFRCNVFVCFICVKNLMNIKFCITLGAADNSFARVLNPHGGAYILSSTDRLFRSIRTLQCG